MPQSRPCEQIDGYGDFRMRCGNAEISFSGEEPGWQVAVDGELDDAEGFLDQITLQVEQATGEPCHWIQIA